jgi:hypothetical protein
MKSPLVLRQQCVELYLVSYKATKANSGHGQVWHQQTIKVIPFLSHSCRVHPISLYYSWLLLLLDVGWKLEGESALNGWVLEFSWGLIFLLRAFLYSQ